MAVAMTLTAFTAAPETDLRLRGVAFAHTDLLAFVAAVWSLVEDDPDAGRWAREFVEATGAEPPANGG